MERNCKLAPEFYDHPSRSLIWCFTTITRLFCLMFDFSDGLGFPKEAESDR